VIDTDPAPSPPAARRRNPIGWLVLLLLVIAGAWGWHAWRTRAENERVAADDAAQRVTALEERLATMRAEQRAQTQRLQQAEMTNRLLRDELLGIGQRAALLEDSVSKLADPDRHGAQAIRLDEVEMLLGMGQHRLQLASDLDGARRAYALAAGMLDGIDDPAYLTLRQTLAQERAALDAKGVDPVRNASATLDVFEAQLARLPASQSARDAASRSWWSRVASRLVDVQPSDRAQLRAASDRSAGLEALGIELTLARAALERRDTAAWQAALGRADAWLPRLWPDTPALRAQRKTLQSLRVQSLAIASPVVGTTLAQLRSRRARCPGVGRYLFRNLLFWIALALVGALVAQVLVQDPGEVLVRFRGHDYRSTVVGASLVLLIALLALWLAWTVLALPFRGWRGFRRRQARLRLTDGLNALQQGHWSRAEKLLEAAGEQDEAAAVARVAAAQAADARGDAAAAQRHLDAIAGRAPLANAIARAERALAAGDAATTLAIVDAPAAQPLPPRGLVLRAQALAALRRAHEAYGMLGALRQQQALPADRLDALQAQWAAASLAEAPDANALADRWDALPKPLQANPAVVGAYAARASAMRWDVAAARNIEQALATQWDEALVDRYGALPITSPEERRAQLERWLAAHPESPATLRALARLQPWGTAEATLHRAVAQGGGAAAWEALAEGYAAAGDAEAARQSYANALRAVRGEPTLALPNRDLRDRIADEAAIEIRDEHGVPRLRE
jgi:heme biosynthesis-associated TPR repeat protein